MTGWTRCSYAGCPYAGTYFDDAERWSFCGLHWREHLALMAEERGRKCTRCDTYFFSETTQRRHCDPCRQTRDTRPSYRQRKAAS